MNYSKKGDVWLPCKTFYISQEYKRVATSDETNSHY